MDQVLPHALVLPDSEVFREAREHPLEEIYESPVASGGS
jgi:hypothetical protein